MEPLSANHRHLPLFGYDFFVPSQLMLVLQELVVNDAALVLQPLEDQLIAEGVLHLETLVDAGVLVRALPLR